MDLHSFDSNRKQIYKSENERPAISSASGLEHLSSLFYDGKPEPEAKKPVAKKLKFQ